MILLFLEEEPRLRLRTPNSDPGRGEEGGNRIPSSSASLSSSSMLWPRASLAALMCELPLATLNRLALDKGRAVVRRRPSEAEEATLRETWGVNWSLSLDIIVGLDGIEEVDAESAKSDTRRGRDGRLEPLWASLERDEEVDMLRLSIWWATGEGKGGRSGRGNDGGGPRTATEGIGG